MSRVGPLLLADTPCAYCRVRAQAVPEEPPMCWEGGWYHRRCLAVARLESWPSVAESQDVHEAAS